MAKFSEGHPLKWGHQMQVGC